MIGDLIFQDLRRDKIEWLLFICEGAYLSLLISTVAVVEKCRVWSDKSPVKEMTDDVSLFILLKKSPEINPSTWNYSCTRDLSIFVVVHIPWKITPFCQRIICLSFWLVVLICSISATFITTFEIARFGQYNSLIYYLTPHLFINDQ